MMNILRRGLAALPLVCVTSALFAQTPSLKPIAYNRDGGITLPDFRKWVFVGAGVFNTADGPNARFSNIFVEPSAYDLFMKTGAWPDRTIIYSDKRSSLSTLPITASPGWGQTGESLGAELEVRDNAKGGWVYYVAGKGESAATRVADQSNCTTCHREHAAVDSVFVQFYPTLAAVAKQHGSFKATN